MKYLLGRAALRTRTGMSGRLTALRRRGFLSNELGQATAEFAVAILAAIALALAVFGLLHGGHLNGPLQKVLEAVLSRAANLAGSS